MEVRKKSITVSQLNRFVAQLLKSQSVLQNLCVQGELSNVKRYSSGHWYFQLKDANAQVSCVMFRTAADALRFKPEDGQEVLLTCTANVYERDGKFQLYADKMEPLGQGDLYLAFEQLKEKLAKEGLFDADKKKPIPPYPKTIGVVTSPTGAVIRDIIHVSKRRFPGCKIVLAPAKVQGEGSAQSIVQGIRYFNTRDDIDCLIVGRGGGSIEDLWAFNEEILARAVFASEIPIISAVGHETDFTICDFVADLRAPTPSAAAELALPDQEALRRKIVGSEQVMRSSLEQKILLAKNRLRHATENRYLKNPFEKFNEKRMTLDILDERIRDYFRRNFERRKERFSAMLVNLDHLSPLKVLSRGYAMVTEEKDDKPLISIEQISINDEVRLFMQDGTLSCIVKDKEEKMYGN